MSDIIPISVAVRDILEDLSRARHPTALAENGKSEPRGEPGSLLPPIDLVVG